VGYLWREREREREREKGKVNLVNDSPNVSVDTYITYHAITANPWGNDNNKN
jgi:hypothetical protein